MAVDEIVKEKDADEKVNPFSAEVETANKARSGKGLRFKTGYTRGKGSMPIKWEAFDESQPDTLPKNVQEFLDVTKANESELLDYLIVGFNDAQYTAASDPIAEHVNPIWDKDTQSQFRVVVRNLAKATDQSIETVVAMVKPGVEKAFSAKKKA